MKTQIFLYSYHHNNTKKVAEAIAAELGGSITEIAPDGSVENVNLTGFGLLGFGAGIDSGKHYPQLLEFVAKLPDAGGKKAFIFSTAGIHGEKKMYKDHRKLRDLLTGKGFEVIGEFACPGYNTNLFLKYFGGMNKGRPNSEDLQRAREFADKLLKVIE